MSNATEVTPEQFEDICALISLARRADEMAKEPGMTLAAKLAYQRRAKELRAQALAIGGQS